MRIKKVRIEDIDLGDERYRISYFFSLDSLIRSIKEIGLVNPPVVAAGDCGFLAVAGWKRILACRELSLSPLPVLLLEEADGLKAFRLAFLENFTVRRFSVLEKAEIICRLKGFGEDERTIIKAYLPLLDIPPTYDHFSLFMNISRLRADEKEMIHKKNFPLAAIERLVEFTPRERKALYPLLMPLGQNKQKDFLEALQELCLSRGLSVNGILEDGELKAVFHSENLSPLQKADKVLSILRKKRFPMLSARQEAFVRAKKRLAWPTDIKISPTPFYEDEKMFIEFGFQSKKEYLKKLSALREAAFQREFTELFDMFPDE